ncbi:MAG: hypothetical protein ACREMK_03970 [Gemmatimonadota bacterium]
MALLRRYLGLNRQHLLAFSLARSLHERHWASDRGTDELDAWFREYLRLNRDLGAGTIAPATWQSGLDRLFAELRLADLLERIDFDVVSRHMRHVGRLGRGELFHLVLLDGNMPEGYQAVEPDRMGMSKLVYVRKGCSVPPHGHSNMVSAFLHLSGEFRVRQYDRLADDGDGLVIRPSTDDSRGPGQWTSVSGDRNNVHWLTAESEDCFIFATKLIRLDETKPYQGRINVDVRNAIDVGGGAIRAPKISAKVAEMRFGRSP